MMNWQGIPTTRLTLGGEVMVPRENSTLAFSTELLNYIIALPFKGKAGTTKYLTIYLVVSCYNVDKKGMSGQSIISIISTNLGPFGAS